MTLLSEIRDTVKNWWLFVLYGVVLIAFSIWVFMTPGSSYLGLALAFSIIILFNGVSHIVFSLSNRKVLSGWGWFLVNGILELFIGVVLLFYRPDISLAILPFILGFWLLFRSVFIGSTAFDLKSLHVKGWGWMLALSIVIAAISFFIITNPVLGAFALVGITGVAFLSLGIGYILFGLRLKQIKKAGKEIKESVSGLFKDFKDSLMKELEKMDDPEKIKAQVKKEVDDLSGKVAQAE